VAQAGAQSTSVSCTKEAGYIARPLVPTRQVALRIYLAVAKGLGKKAPLSKVMVEDEGDHWSVFQFTPPSTTDLGGDREKVVVVSGGGGLEAEIKKCDGSIAAHYSR
jgi:hypothetical protein